VPALRARCAELGALGIPDTLDHGDLWPGNVFVEASTGTCAIIDWEDAAIAHPFLSLAPLMVGLVEAGLATPTHVERLVDAYASAFAALAQPAVVLRGIHLAAPLCFLEMAHRYRKQPHAIVALHPWMRDLVPQAVRLALERL